jgi:hypothetical protein
LPVNEKLRPWTVKGKMEPFEHKDYRLSGFPKEKMAGRSHLPYKEYLEWLTDFLYQAKLEICDKQKTMYESVAQFDPAGAMRIIGTDAGLHDNLSLRRPFYNFPEGFDVHSDKDKAELEDPEFYPYEYLSEEEKEEWSLEEFILEDFEWHLILLEERREFEKYWPEFTKNNDLLPPFMMRDEYILDGKGEPPDAGWRVLLSAILKKLEDREERIHALDSFFTGYIEYLYK